MCTDQPVPVPCHAALVGRPLEDMAARPEPVEEWPQPVGESGQSVVIWEGVSGDGEVEGHVSQVVERQIPAAGYVSVEIIVSVTVTEVVDLGSRW